MKKKLNVFLAHRLNNLYWILLKMSDEEEEIIERLILDGGLEAVGVDEETGEFLYSFTPKIKNLMPDLYNEHITDVNSCIMQLWEKGFLEIH